MFVNTKDKIFKKFLLELIKKLGDDLIYYKIDSEKEIESALFNIKTGDFKENKETIFIFLRENYYYENCNVKTLLIESSLGKTVLLSKEQAIYFESTISEKNYRFRPDIYFSDPNLHIFDLSIKTPLFDKCFNRLFDNIINLVYTVNKIRETLYSYDSE